MPLKIQFLVFGFGLPQTNRTFPATGIQQAATLAARTIAVDVRPEETTALQVFKHGLHELRRSAQLYSQLTSFKRAAITDLFDQFLKHT
jgi:hypothetical protein